MTYLHLPSSREEAQNWNFTLGVPGFRFADLNRVRRLMALDTLFLEDLQQKNPELAACFKQLRETAGEGADPVKLSNTLIQAGKHVGPFIAKIFHIEAQAAELNQRALN